MRTCTRRKANMEKSIANWMHTPVHIDFIAPMLSISACLYNDLSGLDLIDIYQR
jgi:hypothetical protein